MTTFHSFHQLFLLLRIYQNSLRLDLALFQNMKLDSKVKPIKE